MADFESGILLIRSAQYLTGRSLEADMTRKFWERIGLEYSTWREARPAATSIAALCINMHVCLPLCNSQVNHSRLRPS